MTEVRRYLLAHVGEHLARKQILGSIALIAMSGTVAFLYMLLYAGTYL